jgi:hypothetical protein
MSGSRFVEELLAELPPDSQRAALSVLRRWGGTSVYLPTVSAAERQRRHEVAALLLRSGIGRRDAARILRERFGIGERQARRILARVGQVSRNGVRSAG